MKHYRFNFSSSYTSVCIAVICCCVAATLPAPAQPAAGKKPNIIFILVDDMGWGDVGAFWQNQRLKKNDRSEPWQFTPSLDAMASNGAMLTNHYCAAPVCAPSRASILLGQHQGHANVRNNQFDKELQNTYTMPSVLRQAGYATALIGKWGLQGATDSVPNWPAHPLKRGFDYSLAYMRHVDGHEHYPKEQVYVTRGKKEVWENYENIAGNLDKCFTTDLWTAAAKKYIIEQNKTAAKKPFFLYLAYDVPHAVLELATQVYPAGGGLKGGLQWTGKPGNMINTASGTPDSYVHPDYARATYDDDKDAATPEVAWPDTYKRYASLCRRIDDGIGDIIQLLKDLDIEDNTMVVFTSDNGPSIESYLPDSFVPNHPTFFNSFGPFDGIKRDCWEGGVRMPTIVQWKGSVPPNKVLDQPSASYDWLPTFAQAAGIPVPARVDGVSLLPQLTGKGKQSPGVVYIEYENSSKTPAFKEFAPNHRGRQRNQMQKLRIGDLVGVRYNITSAKDDFEIYNVVHDPQESTNLAGTLKYDDLQQQLKDKVLQLRMADTSAIRPYDDALVPAVKTQLLKKGLTRTFYRGDFPWVANVSSVPATGVSVVGFPNVEGIPKAPGMVMLKGYINIPQDGMYHFYVEGNNGSIMRIHDALVLDGSFDYKPGTLVKGTMHLAKGYHPVTIYYLINNTMPPKISLRWSTPGKKMEPIPAQYWFR